MYLRDQRPGLITQELLCSRVLFIKGRKGTEEASDTDIRRGMESAPLTSLIKVLYTFTRPTPTTYILN